MFVLSYKDNALFRGIATLVTIALLMWVVGMHVQTAQAANLTDVSNTLSTSEPGVVSDHEIAFTIPAGSDGIDTAGEQITVTFPTGFNLSTSSVAFGDVDIEINTTDGTIVDGLTPAVGEWGFDVTGQVLTLESGGGTATATAGDNIVIKVGQNADGGSNQVTNHSVSGQSYEFVVDVASSQDTGRTRVAIVDTVLVTASVDTSFDFTVTGFSTAGTGVNGTSTTGTTSATTLPFGTLTAGEIETLAQRLNVATNAINGYVVTVETDQQLLSSTGADIDGFQDGGFDNTPIAWATPSNNISDENTWGHWGLTSEDSDLNGDEFGSNLWVSASTTPRQIMSHTGPADGVTDDIGSTTVGYQVEITALQEAGDDYNSTLTYIATPTF